MLHKGQNTNHYPEIIGSLFCLTLGMLSGYSRALSDMFWYDNLIKPTFNPPPWVFGPVWTILYLMMGITFGILWKNRIDNKILITIFILQLVLNLIWSPIFFYFQSITWALLDICLLWALLVTFMFVSRNQRSIFLLFIPYCLWVSFALILNVKLYMLNVID